MTPVARSISRHPVARRIVLSTRRLLGEAGLARETPVLIACSGGADSTALAASLAGASAMGPRIVAHIRHDTRPAPESSADESAVMALASTLGLPFARAEANAGAEGTEAVYRRLRYGALADLAREHDAPCIATAHHADDQLETLLMRLFRGASHRGMRGIAPWRTLPGGARLIRPMLDVTSAQARSLCRDAGLVWREDPTNADPSANRRAAFRAWLACPASPSPPNAGRLANHHARLMRDITALVAEAADALEQDAGGIEPRGPLKRSALAASRDAVLGEVIRRRCELAGAPASVLDAVKLQRVARAIRSPSTDPKRIQLGKGVEVRVLAATVVVERGGRDTSSDHPTKTPAETASDRGRKGEGSLGTVS